MADGVGLVAVGNSDGLVVVYDLTKHLMLWETWSFRVDEDRINRGLTLPYQQTDEQWEKFKQNISQQKQPGQPSAQEDNKKQQEEKQEEKEKDERGSTIEEKEKQQVIETEPHHQQQEASKPDHQKQESDQELKATTKEGNVKTKPSTSQSTHSVSSCKLHSLGIVQLMKQGDSQDSSAQANGSKKDSDSLNVDPSLLIGVSFCRSSGIQDAAIIVCDIHTNSPGKSVVIAAKKSKVKSTALSSAGIGVEVVADPLLDIDDVMPPALPITVDFDTPSWELVPPLPPEPPLISSTIPPAPPPPPLKSSDTANKIETGSQLQIFVVSEYIDDIPSDAHPVVSVIQPCGHSRVAVALAYGPSHGGCVILFNLEHCIGKTILGKNIIHEFEIPGLQVSDMCVMENLETGKTVNSHFLATINKSGSFIVYSMEMNIIVSMNVTSDPLVSCFPCLNVGLFGVVSRSGVVKTVKIVGGKPVAEVNVLAASAASSDSLGDNSISTNPHKG